MVKIVTSIICALLLSVTAFAHPGRTDTSGGHNDNINGGYHYHHGYPAHDHIDGWCPYEDNEPYKEAQGGEVLGVVSCSVFVLYVVARVKDKLERTSI